MKRRSLTFGIICFLLLACRDEANVSTDPSNSSIVGKWNIVADDQYVGVGINNHKVSYIGKAGDYFDVRSDGHIYVKEDFVLDTLAYTVQSSQSIIIAGFGAILNGTPEVSTISYLSPTFVTIKAPAIITPGGAFGRTITLSR
jgi:hypothetical protein